MTGHLPGSHQPDRHRANKPVASLGGRPDDDSLRADLAGHTAQRGEWVAARGHEGDGDAPLLGCLFDLAAPTIEKAHRSRGVRGVGRRDSAHAGGGVQGSAGLPPGGVIQARGARL